MSKLTAAQAKMLQAAVGRKGVFEVSTKHVGDVYGTRATADSLVRMGYLTPVLGRYEITDTGRELTTALAKTALEAEAAKIKLTEKEIEFLKMVDGTRTQAKVEFVNKWREQISSLISKRFVVVAESHYETTELGKIYLSTLTTPTTTEANSEQATAPAEDSKPATDNSADVMDKYSTPAPEISDFSGVDKYDDYEAAGNAWAQAEGKRLGFVVGAKVRGLQFPFRGEEGVVTSVHFSRGEVRVATDFGREGKSGNTPIEDFEVIKPDNSAQPNVLDKKAVKLTAAQLALLQAAGEYEAKKGKDAHFSVSRRATTSSSVLTGTETTANKLTDLGYFRCVRGGAFATYIYHVTDAGRAYLSALKPVDAGTQDTDDEYLSAEEVDFEVAESVTPVTPAVVDGEKPKTKYKYGQRVKIKGGYGRISDVYEDDDMETQYCVRVEIGYEYWPRQDLWQHELEPAEPTELERLQAENAELRKRVDRLEALRESVQSFVDRIPADLQMLDETYDPYKQAEAVIQHALAHKFRIALALTVGSKAGS